MKRILFLLIVFSCSGAMLYAQKGKQTHLMKTSEPDLDKPGVVQLISTGSYQALVSSQGVQQLTISDPTLKWFNERSAAENPQGFSVPGVSRFSYGIGHGKLILHPTASATFGTSTGTGTVGTGSSLGNAGTNESGLGVNGKNPYAGPAMYGTRVLSDLRDDPVIQGKKN